MLLPATITPLGKPRMLARWEHVACYAVPEKGVYRRNFDLVVPYETPPCRAIWEYVVRLEVVLLGETGISLYHDGTVDPDILHAAVALAALPATGLQGAYDRAYQHATEIDTVEAWAMVASRQRDLQAWQQQTGGSW
jgi:hypothetical protein